MFVYLCSGYWVPCRSVIPERACCVFMFTWVLLFSGWCRGVYTEMSCCLMAWWDDGSNQWETRRALKSLVPPFSRSCTHTHTHTHTHTLSLLADDWRPEGFNGTVEGELRSELSWQQGERGLFLPPSLLSLCTWTELHLTRRTGFTHSHTHTHTHCSSGVPPLCPQYTQLFVSLSVCVWSHI